MSTPVEIWKDVPGTQYQVSNLGALRRVTYLRASITKHGYVKYSHRVGSKIRTATAHILVAEAFLGPRPDGAEVNHKDCDKTNNNIDNLEYVSKLENAQHARKNERYKRGENHTKSKLTEAMVRDMRKSYATGKYTFATLGEFYGVTKATAHKAVRGHTYA